MQQEMAMLIILGLALPCVTGKAGTIYRWTDEQGEIHFSDKSPASGISVTIIQQHETVSAKRQSGLRPGERVRLDRMEQRQRQQHKRAIAARTRADHVREFKRKRCAENREMLKNSRGPDKFKKYSRYLRNNCW